jgi:integrase
MSAIVREKRKGSGIWWVFIRHQGHRKSKKVGGDRAKAEKLATIINGRLAAGDLGVIEDDSEGDGIITLKEYLDDWLPDSRLFLKYSTRAGYASIIKTHLLPTWGSTPLDQITAPMIKKYLYSSIQDGLSSGTARNIKNCLSAIFRHAVTQDQIVEANPARAVIIPKPEGEGAIRVPSPFSREERDSFEETLIEHYPHYYPMIVCGFRTGLRIGELIGLQRGDVNLFNKVILVRHNITNNRKTTPKSKASVRRVRMTTQLAAIIQRAMKQGKADKLKYGWEQVPEQVFYSPESGNHVNYGNFVYRVWRLALEEAELPHRTPHDMRHTYATLRLSAGHPLAEVSKEMGHSTPNITYRTYYEFLPKESTSDIDILDGNVSGKNARKSASGGTPMAPIKRDG